MKNQLIGVFCLALAATAWTQSAAPGALKQDPAHSYALYPAGSVLDLKVRNDSDKNLGEIGDLLIDQRSGEIRFAVLDVGGFLGVGEDHRIIPWSFIQIVPDEKDAEKVHARTTLTEDQVKAAPTCKRDERKTPVELDKRIEATFGKNEAWAYAGKDEPAFLWCKQMDKVEIKDPARKEVGKVQRLVVAPANNCVAYVVVDANKDAGGKNVALPWPCIAYAYDSERKLTATTPVEIVKFTSAPEYDSKDWKRMTSTAWINELSTYYECDPFWKTSRFASARKSPPKGP